MSSEAAKETFDEYNKRMLEKAKLRSTDGGEVPPAQKLKHWTERLGHKPWPGAVGSGA